MVKTVKTPITIWLFNSSPWKIIIFKNGKPSISMGHLYHGYVSHNQRVNDDIHQPGVNRSHKIFL